MLTLMNEISKRGSIALDEDARLKATQGKLTELGESVAKIAKRLNKNIHELSNPYVDDEYLYFRDCTLNVFYDLKKGKYSIYNAVTRHSYNRMEQDDVDIVTIKEAIDAHEAIDVIIHFVITESIEAAREMLSYEEDEELMNVDLRQS